MFSFVKEFLEVNYVNFFEMSIFLVDTPPIMMDSKRKFSLMMGGVSSQKFVPKKFTTYVSINSSTIFRTY
jgi:hypothetical protein